MDQKKQPVLIIHCVYVVEKDYIYREIFWKSVSKVTVRQTLSYPASSHCVRDSLRVSESFLPGLATVGLCVCRWDSDRGEDKNGKTEIQAKKKWVTCTEKKKKQILWQCSAVWSTEVTVSEGTGISLLKWVSASTIAQNGCKMLPSSYPDSQGKKYNMQLN